MSMLARFTFAVSAICTLLGSAAAILGILYSEFRGLAVGFVLIATGGVGALLYLGEQYRASRSVP